MSEVAMEEYLTHEMLEAFRDNEVDIKTVSFDELITIQSLIYEARKRLISELPNGGHPTYIDAEDILAVDSGFIESTVITAYLAGKQV